MTAISRRMPSRVATQGFTLIEIAVVILIIATLSAISMVAVYQAGDRRQAVQADRVQIWLQQLSERALLEGVAYGVVVKNDHLQPLVYFRQRWFQLTTPEPFELRDDGQFVWNPKIPEKKAEASAPDQQVPDFTLSPDGMLEPDGSIQLVYAESAQSFAWRWNPDSTTLEMQLERP